MQRKGQAAMEFLMTYGWAILAAIIVIGILGFYFFGRGLLTPPAGVVREPFYLNAWNAKASTGITLELQNKGDETYTIQSIAVTNCGTTATAPGDVAAGALQATTITCTTALVEGETFNGDITITYIKSGSSVSQTVSGSVRGRVAA